LPAIVLEIVLGIVIGPQVLGWVSLDTPIEVLSLAVGAAVLGAERSMRISATLLRLQDTTAEIRVRASFLLLTLFAVLAERLGLEAILGAFLAGAIVKLVDRDQMMTHPEFRRKLEAVDYGVFVPVFFVATGVRFDLDGLFANATNLARVPIFVVALLVARGLPALVYRSITTGTQAVAAGCYKQPRSASWSSPAKSVYSSIFCVQPSTRRLSQQGSYRCCCSRLRPHATARLRGAVTP
jgi:Kef-type K+ transport system membrane component KefB